MLKRLAAVLWWAGLLIAGGGTLFGLAAGYAYQDCAFTLQLQAEIDRTALANSEPRFLVDTTDHGSPGSAAQRDPRDTPLQHSHVAACRAATPEWLSLAAALTLALMLWTLAYALGGRQRSISVEPEPEPETSV